MTSNPLAPREARIRWEQLGWRAPLGGPAPAFNQAPVGFLVVAPWCPDCQELGQAWKALVRPGQACWLVGEFTPESELQAFRQALGVDWPILLGTSSKTQLAWIEARFRQLRAAFGDSRRWGLPTWIEGRLEHGSLVVTGFRSNF